MIGNLRVLAVVPARGGSKGVPKKNLRRINGVPLVTLTGQVVLKDKYIDQAIVSTDNEDIASAAIKDGLKYLFKRPKSLSGDKISDLQVLTHALKTTEKLDNVKYDIVVMLQPTSPMRNVKHIKDTIEMLVRENFDSVWTVSETDTKSHPLKQLTIKKNRLDYYDLKGKKIIARQQLEPVYHRNGLVYAFTRNCILNKKSIMGDKAGALFCKGHFVSIDTEFDFKLVEFIMNETI